MCCRPAVFLPGEQAARGFAFINSLGAVGGFLGPYVLGLLTDRKGGGLGPSFLFLACCLFAAGAALLAFPAPGHQDPAGEYGLAEDGLKRAAGDEDGGREGSGSGSPSHAAQRADAAAAAAPPLGSRLSHQRRGSSKQLLELECQPILPAGSGRSA